MSGGGGEDVSYIPLPIICPILEFSLTLRLISYMNNLLNGISEQMTKLPYTHLLHDNSYDFFLVFSLPRGKKHRKPMPALLPIHLIARGGAGGVAGWALPCFLSLLTRGRGQGAGDNPYT